MLRRIRAAQNNICAKLSRFFQSAHHNVLDEEVLLNMTSLLDEPALLEASSPYVVASIDEA